MHGQSALLCFVGSFLPRSMRAGFAYEIRITIFLPHFVNNNSPSPSPRTDFDCLMIDRICIIKMDLELSFPQCLCLNWTRFSFEFDYDDTNYGHDVNL